MSDPAPEENKSFFDKLKDEVMDRKPASVGSGKNFHPVRRMPKGTSVSTKNDREAVLTFPAAIKTWWMLPYVLALPIILLALSLGVYLGFVSDKWITDSWGRDQYQAAYFTIWPAIIFTAISFGLVAFLWSLVNPTITVRVTPEAITIGKYHFDRTHVHGMRIGYEITYTSDKKSAFSDSQIFFTGLRMQYGQWGEDLNYMVKKYHAAEYIIWMNEIIAEVGAPAPAEHDPSEGRKTEEF